MGVIFKDRKFNITANNDVSKLHLSILSYTKIPKVFLIIEKNQPDDDTVMTEISTFYGSR